MHSIQKFQNGKTKFRKRSAAIWCGCRTKDRQLREDNKEGDAQTNGRRHWQHERDKERTNGWTDGQERRESDGEPAMVGNLQFLFVWNLKVSAPKTRHGRQNIATKEGVQMRVFADAEFRFV